MPGGFHPFHAGHYSLYKAAKEKFPDADIYVAATNDTKTRPFPFEIKKKLAQLAGVDPNKFVQVKSPFKPDEITSKYDPEQDVVIFVRSEKDRNEQPKPGGTKKDGSPAFFQPYTEKSSIPFGKHAYMDYLPTIEFGPGIKSATEIRNSWPRLNDKQKLAMIMSLYPATQKNKKLADIAVKMLDAGIVGNEINEEKEEKQDLNPKDILATPDEQEILSFVRKHYPEAPSTQAAFIKYVLHSLEHSKEDSERQDDEIQKLMTALKKLEREVKNIETQPQAVQEAYSEPLTELFNTKGGVRWRGSNWSYVYGNFTSSNGIKYRIQLSSPMYGPSELDPSSFFKDIDTSTALKAKYLEFDQIDETNTRKSGIEGTGAAAEVFGIVINAILKYIKNNETSMIYFQAKEINRVRLYRSIIKMLLSRLPGWATKEVSGKKKSMLGNFAIYNTNLISDKPSVKEVQEAYSDDTEELNKNLRYSRSRDPVASDIRKHLGMTKPAVLAQADEWRVEQDEDGQVHLVDGEGTIRASFDYDIWEKLSSASNRAFNEATLINDPEQGHLIVPDGGMGTWDEQSLLSNLVRKFASMAEMIKEKRYNNLYHSLYKAGVIENMLKALVQYEKFKEKQGNRPLAKGKQVDISESTDYISEK